MSNVVWRRRLGLGLFASGGVGPLRPSMRFLRMASGGEAHADLGRGECETGGGLNVFEVSGVAETVVVVIRRGAVITWTLEE